jgi:multidrug efflux pump subunit AcrA (membrane-fusion protein)
MPPIPERRLRARPLPLLAVLLLATAAGCGGERDAQRRREAPARPEYAASARGRVDIEGGVVRLAARRDGVIQSVLVEEGAHVRSGDLRIAG